MSLINKSTESKCSLIVLPEQEYLDRIIETIKLANSENYAICYVVLSKPCNGIVQWLKKEVDLKNIFFINAFLKDFSAEETAFCPSNAQCVTIKPEITIIKEHLSNFVSKKPKTIILVDTVSALLNNEHTASILHLTNSIISGPEFENNHKVYLVLKDVNVKTAEYDNLIKDLRMFA